MFICSSGRSTQGLPHVRQTLYNKPHLQLRSGFGAPYSNSAYPTGFVYLKMGKMYMLLDYVKRNYLTLENKGKKMTSCPFKNPD